MRNAETVFLKHTHGRGRSRVVIINEPKMSPSPLHFCDVIFVLSVRLSSAHPFGFGSVPIFSRTRTPRACQLCRFVRVLRPRRRRRRRRYTCRCRWVNPQVKQDRIQCSGKMGSADCSVSNHIWSSTKIKSS